DDAFAPDGLPAALDELAGDVAARHRDHLDRQRKAPEHVDALARIDHADEGLRRRGDDLLARERRAAALDEPLVRIAFVGAVDVKREFADGIEIDDADAMPLEPRRALLRARYRGVDAAAHRGQRVDEIGHRRTRADANDAAFLDVADRAFRGEAFFAFLVHRAGLFESEDEIPVRLRNRQHRQSVS